jgi:uncharacterized membrane protein YidH (DUF202 family)
MSNLQSENQVAIFTCVLAVALIGTSVGLLGVIWKRFERRFRKQKLEDREATIEITIWFIIAAVLVGTVPSIVAHWRPGWLESTYYACAFLYLGAMIIWAIVRRARKREKVRAGDFETTAYFATWWVIAIGIFWESLALLGVIGTALGMKLGPFGPDNYNWGKLSLFFGVAYFGMGIFLYLLGYMCDSGERFRKIRSNEGNGGAEKDEMLRPDGDDDGV